MKRPPYPTDLTDEQWQRLEPLIPPRKPGGRPRKTDMREVLNAIQYLLRTGCQWYCLPHDFPPQRTVYYYFWSWGKTDTRQQIHDQLRAEVRKQAGRQESPSAGVIDSQTVKTTEQPGPRGYDGGKKVTGRKRHLLVDTLGLLLALWVLPANLSDPAPGRPLLGRVVAEQRRLKTVWGYQQYAEVAVERPKTGERIAVEVVKRPAAAKGWVHLPKRWIVERTFGRFGGYRRLSKDYEATCRSSEDLIHAAMINLMLHRLHPG